MTPAAIADADPQPWQGERKPDPTPAELAVLAAGRRYGNLADKIETWTEARSGAAYDDLVRRWRKAGTEALRLARELPRDA